MKIDTQHQQHQSPHADSQRSKARRRTSCLKEQEPEGKAPRSKRKRPRLAARVLLGLRSAPCVAKPFRLGGSYSGIDLHAFLAPLLRDPGGRFLTGEGFPSHEIPGAQLEPGDKTGTPLLWLVWMYETFELG